MNHLHASHTAVHAAVMRGRSCTQNRAGKHCLEEGQRVAGWSCVPVLCDSISGTQRPNTATG